MLFSVIVPIYKVEDYLKRCLDSVLSQDYADFELILVDDGSPDNCPAICDEYARNDSRIKVIHKENGGLVSARQAGIEIAQGEYIFNLDSDDALLPGAFSDAARIIKETDADIVTFAYQIYKNGNISEKITEIVPEGLYDKNGIDEHILPKVLMDENMQHVLFFLWGKAIRRSLVTQHQLNVSRKVSLGEDIVCVAPVYTQATRVFVSYTPIYLYTIRGDSLSTSFSSKHLNQIDAAVDCLKKSIGGLKGDYPAQISRYSCFMCFAIIAAAAEGGHFSAIGDIKEIIDKTHHGVEIPKARFKKITVKSKIAVWLMQKKMFGAAFYFLYICKIIKNLLGKGE